MLSIVFAAALSKDVESSRAQDPRGQGNGVDLKSIPASETQRLAELLRCAGVDVTIRFAHARHALTDFDVKTAQHWLEGLEP
jgi:predicted esterase